MTRRFRCEGTDIAFLRLDTRPRSKCAVCRSASRADLGHRVKTYGHRQRAVRRALPVTRLPVTYHDGLLQLTECTEDDQGLQRRACRRRAHRPCRRNGDVGPCRHRPARPGRFDCSRRSGRNAAETVPLPPHIPDVPLMPACSRTPQRMRRCSSDATARSVSWCSPACAETLAFLVGSGLPGAASPPFAGWRASCLRARSLPGSDRWAPVTVTPEPTVRGPGRCGAGGSARLAGSWPEAHPGHDRLVLVLDQFEEVLVQAPPETRLGLLRQLTDVVNHDLDLPVTVIIVTRDDFYSTLAAAAPALLERGLVNVTGHA